jgi:hypothetical protein
VANASDYSWSYFRGQFSASVFSVKFRVRPWLMLLLILGLISVANFQLMFFFVKFRVNPWQMLLLLSFLFSVSLLLSFP